MYKLSTTSFSDCAHSVAIVSHAITITSKAIPKPKTNCGYSFDQHLFVLTKTIQWSRKGSAGEDKLVLGKKNIYMSVEPVAVVSYVINK